MIYFLYLLENISENYILLLKSYEKIFEGYKIINEKIINFFSDYYKKVKIQ